MLQVYMLSLSSQPVDHEEPGKQMVLGDQVSSQQFPFPEVDAALD
jgi:hypothetical protein